MLNCLAASIGTRERVVTVAEIFELQFPLRDVGAAVPAGKCFPKYTCGP